MFFLSKSLEDVHILEGEEGGLKRKWGELNFKQVAPIAHRIDRLLMCGGDFSPKDGYRQFAAGDFLRSLDVFPQVCPCIFTFSNALLSELSRLATSYFVISCGHSVCSQYLEASKTALLFGLAV